MLMALVLVMEMEMEMEMEMVMVMGEEMVIGIVMGTGMEWLMAMEMEPTPDEMVTRATMSIPMETTSMTSAVQKATTAQAVSPPSELKCQCCRRRSRRRRVLDLLPLHQSCTPSWRVMKTTTRTLTIMATEPARKIKSQGAVAMLGVVTCHSHGLVTTATPVHRAVNTRASNPCRRRCFVNPRRRHRRRCQRL